jgi:hypothetical protein
MAYSVTVDHPCNDKLKEEIDSLRAVSEKGPQVHEFTKSIDIEKQGKRRGKTSHVYWPL